MKLTTVKEIYKNREEYLNREVTVGGWVRSVRGSKAFGFIVLHDGTFFETLQVVYHDNMPNFAEISKLNVGAAIIVRGTLVPTPEAKQPFETGRRRICTGLSASEETSYSGIPENHDTFETENKHFPGGISCTFPLCIRDPQILPGKRFRICTHTADHRK